MGFIDEVSESFKQSLKPSLTLYFFVIKLVEAIAVAVVFGIFGILALAAVLGPLGGFSEGSLKQIVSTPSILANVATSLLLIGLAFGLVVLFINSFFTGVQYNLFSNFLKSKKLDLGKAFDQSRPRTFAFFLVQLIIIVLTLLLFTVLLSPAFFSLAGLLPLLQAISQQEIVLRLIGIAIYAILGFLLGSVILFFVSPILYLLPPVVFFEKLGVPDSVRRAVALAKANYWGNIGFVLFHMVILIGAQGLISSFFMVVFVFAFVMGIVPAITSAASFSAGSFGPGFLGLMTSMVLMQIIIIVGYIFYAFAMFIYLFWSLVFKTACFTNLYFYDKELLGKPKGKKATANRGL